jgi:hypothetical protein
LLDALAAQIAEGPLEDHPTDLQAVVPGVIADQQVTAAGIGAHARPVLRTGQLAPHDVHGRSEVARRQAAAPPHRRSASIGAHHQIGTQVLQRVFGPGAHAHHPASLDPQFLDRSAALQAELRALGRLRNQHLQQAGLRDRPGRALPLRRGVDLHAEDESAVQIEGSPLERVAGHRRERLAQAHLLEGVDAARHQELAAELAGEVPLSLEQGHLNAAMGQQVRKARACRTGADDQHVGQWPTLLRDWSCDQSGIVVDALGLSSE